jgi:WS/DGAT/MGAT family acyltransferase
MAVGDRLRGAGRAIRGHSHPSLPPLRGPGGVRDALRRARRAYREELEPRAPASPLNGPLSEDRAYAFASHDLADVRRAERSVPAEATVNDVVLATIADGLGRWLGPAGLPDAGLRAQVPVSLVEHGQASFGKSTSFMIVDLPVSESDPLRRVERVAAETSFRKRGGAEAIRSLMSLAFRLPRPLRARVLSRVTSDRVQNLIVSDIPGPPQQLYFMGGRVSAVYPLMMLSPRHRLRIGAVSLGGTISFGLTADPAALGDPQALAQGIEASLDELARDAG